ncbi:uncharacterized protein LOC121889493 [Thunnus maccoyii]|uniref:uncharacterized protein LOC121889493 n=1 Tax=Thunnus maccoyii TaxID=8240 RepID=UPI001C4B3061|nr:uncharacterized protein LOC121889493 [Thunnus maccoyii]
MEPFSSRCHASDQLGSRRSTCVHAMAHSDAALFQAINIFNRMFARLRRALKKTAVPLLRNDDKDKLSNSMQTLLPSTLSPAAQILSLFWVHCLPPGQRTPHTDDVTPPTATEPRLLQPWLKARLNSGYKSRFTELTTKPGSSCSSLPPPPPLLWMAAHFRVPRPAPPVRRTLMTSRHSQLLQPSCRARSYLPLCLLPPCLICLMFFVFSLIPVSAGCTINPRTCIPSSFPLPFLQLQLPLRFRLDPLQQLLLLCFFPQPPPVQPLPQQQLHQAKMLPPMGPLNFLLFYPCSPPFPNIQMFFLCLQHFHSGVHHSTPLWPTKPGFPVLHSLQFHHHSS